ncbi:virulence-associated E family protein [Acetobacterium wieringae]|uniref:Virulence-associated protein E n=1 Tax=Acetobacterium wieringae TaxID=52694 RepID=A0A1F2PEW8_9FIRM|nr:virulence-associated E family protein [Acetobacterium wieringae]OFV69605.1 virulence-associated protein E [Acetobacterium wieringae]
MRDLNIAYGNSRAAKQWSNKNIRFDELKERLKVTIRTSESAEEYAKFSKAKRDDAKDHGGFVAGVLKGGRRRIDSVESRSMVALDGDRIDEAFLLDYEKNTAYTSVLYTTHSHTDENPRVRLVFPLTRDVNQEEYVAVARYLAQMLGMDYFDECSYQPNQLMYWPSTPANGTFLYKEIDGDWINPDDILLAHPEWTDPTRLPTSSRESKANTANFQKVQDPLEKEGVVGLFNRVFFPVTLAIDTFLSDVYEPTDSDSRFHLIASSSMAGVEIKENGKFVYSHHAKDPAYLKLCNAFDIVRIHKFGNDDDNKSFKSMCEFAMKQEKVKLRVLEERQSQIDDDFSDDGDWRSKLRYMPRSKCLENSVWNLMLILNNDTDFANIAFNEMAGRIEITGSVPWERPVDNRFWRDADTAQMKALIDIKYQSFSSRNHDVAFTKAVEDRHFHPARDYFDSLPEWDKVQRIESLLIDYFGAEDNTYTKATMRKTLIAAVARTYHPGVKFDSALILVGTQGIGKSTFFSKLAGSWFSDSLTLTDMKDKSGAEKLQGFLILELGEMAGMKKVDIEIIKSFLSRTDDIYRPSYGRVVESHPRQCIVVGSTNAENGFLRDITGNRRFWPVNVHSESAKKSWQLTENEVSQIWAETLYLYNQGENLYLEGKDLIIAEEQQKQAMETDERQGLVEDYLNTLLPENWESMSLFERKNFLSGDDFGGSKIGTVERKQVCNAEIWCECFGNNLSAIKSADSYAIAAIMIKIDGWEKSSKRKKISLYGQQRMYEKLSLS